MAGVAAGVLTRALPAAALVRTRGGAIENPLRHGYEPAAARVRTAFLRSSFNYYI